jgi:hypothetical protein
MTAAQLPACNIASLRMQTDGELHLIVLSRRSSSFLLIKIMIRRFAKPISLVRTARRRIVNREHEAKYLVFEVRFYVT